MIYCTYNVLNMFRALICSSSRAGDYTCIIAAYDVYSDTSANEDNSNRNHIR